jgi:hypothetical protein
MSNLQIKQHNAETNEALVRDMTEAEVKALELFRAEAQAEKEAREQKELNKKKAEAKLAALGLTADDLRALGL